MEQMKKDMILEMFKYISVSEMLDATLFGNEYVSMVIQLLNDHHNALVMEGQTTWSLPAEIHQTLIDMKE